MYKFENYKLGETDDLLQIDTIEQHRLAVTLMARQARRHIDIVSRDLDPPVYDHPELIDILKHLVLNSWRARVRIIVFEPAAIMHRGHRLVETALTLTTFFELRRAGEEHKHFNGSLFLADRIGYIHRLNSERYEGTLNFKDVRQSQLFMNEIEEMWGKAAPDSNLRRLSL